MTTESRILPGVTTGGQFAAHTRTEADIALDAIIADRNAFWEPGIIHPSGGYDNIRTDELGNSFYTADGLLHREDGPAVVLGDGTEEWYCEGALHREDDLPASVSSTGEKEWRRYGSQHRDGDKPAVTSPDGNAIYIVDGKLHRGGGKPAVIYPSGHTEWWVDGELHRAVEYGPAKIRSNGESEYWVAGKRVHPEGRDI